MNKAQKNFIQVALVILAIILILASWKFLPPDDYWWEYPYRIVFKMDDGQEFGFESRFKNLAESLIFGLIVPLVLIGTVIFFRLGVSNKKDG